MHFVPLYLSYISQLSRLAKIWGGRDREANVHYDTTIPAARRLGPLVPQMVEHHPDSWGSLWGLVL